MKARVEQAVLAAATADAARVLPNRPLSPVMAGVRLDAVDGALTLSAFDYERSLTVTIPADVGEPGTLLLPGRALAGLVASLSGTVDISDDGRRTTLAAGRSRVTLPVGRIEDYPAVPQGGQTTVTVAASDLAACLSDVAWSVEVNGLKALAYVQVDAQTGGEITLAATDRHVLSVRRVAADVRGEFTVLVLPRDLTDALRGHDGDVQLGLTGGVLTVAGPGRVSTLRTGSEEFPLWPRLIPSDFDRTAVVDRDELLEAASLAQRADERPGIPIVLTVVDDGFTFEGGSRDESDGNQVAGHVDADMTPGDDLTIAVAPEFLIGPLKALDAGPVRLSLQTKTRPFVVEQDDLDGLHLIMPIRL